MGTRSESSDRKLRSHGTLRERHLGPRVQPMWALSVFHFSARGLAVVVVRDCFADGHHWTHRPKNPWKQLYDYLYP
jgi:hypothetical protein